MYAEEQGTFSFGAVVPSQTGKLGVAERLKISNHNKIKCVVKFSLTMRGIDEGKTEETGAAFRIQPASIELPPHEHRYVTVYFKPNEMRSYTAAFEANVEDALVTVSDDARHNLETGDYVTFTEIKGLTELNGCEPRRVTVKSPYTFTIGSTMGMNAYERGGLANQVKMPSKHKFKSLQESLVQPGEFLMSDFGKFFSGKSYG